MTESLTLDELDRQLTHALQIDGRASFSRIAQALGISDRTIARRYHRLRSTGALRVIGTPDERKTGQVKWMVRVRCAPDMVTPAATTLAQRDDTSWVGLTSGGTEVTCVTRTGTDDLLLPKLSRSPRISSVIAHCLLRTVAGADGWPGLALALRPEQIRHLAHPPMPQRPSLPVTLSSADEQLFAVLAKDGRTEIPALAAAAGWSESTTRRRLAELRRAGYLNFDVDINSALLGYTAVAILWLTVAPAALAATARALARHQEVAFASITTGPANLVATLVCQDTDALYDYLAERIGPLPGVIGAETAPITRLVKRAGTLLPI